MQSLFSPDYGAAKSHIAELTKEREDFVAASFSQAASIASLEKQVASPQKTLALKAVA